jgi:hypothetical protein
MNRCTGCRSKGSRTISWVVCALLAIAPTLAGSPNNDDCIDAETIQSLPHDVTEQDIEEATVQTSDPFPSCTGFARQHTVWWHYTPAVDHWIRITTAGSDFDSFLWITTGGCGGMTLACDDNGIEGTNAEIVMGLQAGTTYTIVAGAVSTIVDGTLQFLVEDYPSPLTSTTGDATWSAAASPHVFITDFTILAGHTITLEPGTTIDLQGGRLFVEGSLVGSGTPLSPIQIGGVGRLVGRGTITLDHALIEARTEPDNGGSLTFVDSTFQGYGALTNWGAPTYIWADKPFVHVERCNFNGVELTVGAAHVLVRDVTVTNDWVDLGGYPLVENLTVDGSPYQGLQLWGFEQPVFVDDVTVTNSAGAGITAVAGNYLFGGNVVLQNNLYPLEMGGSGILAPSALPPTGNVNNYIRVDGFSDAVARMIWTDPGIPYVIVDSYTGGSLEIREGVTVQLMPNATFWGEPGFVDVRGLPLAPVTFERFDPASSWQGLQYFHRYENAIIDGGQVGARFHSSTGAGFMDNCIVRNNDFGSQNDAVVRKTRFLNNTTGTWGNNWPESLESTTNPNSFVSNTLAVEANGNLIDARYNWWGDPSGATAPDNPGGSGDSVSGPGVATVPFLTAEPNFADAPPIVRVQRSASVLDPGTPLIISWSSEDDVSVVSQRIEFYHPLNGMIVLADGLPPARTNFFWQVPDVGVIVNNVLPRVRVVAVDSSGQEGWDELRYLISTGTIAGNVTITTDLTGPFRAGDDTPPLCWDEVGTDPYVSNYSYLVFDGDTRSIPLGGTTTNCLSLNLEMPFVSSDSARVVLSLSDGLNRVKHFFSNSFAVRPDSRLGDAAPTIGLTDPLGGEIFLAGGTVPVRWTASDDTGLRSFDIQASYDGGRTWHFLAEGLPPGDRSFDWPLPPDADVPDVRLRVLAADLRFQTSSATTASSFAVSSDPSACSSPPGGVQGVTVQPNEVTLDWSARAGATSYDVARGQIVDLAAAVPSGCMGNTSQTTWDDFDVPSSGSGYYYIVRAVNACGAGDWGGGQQSRAAQCP